MHEKNPHNGKNKDSNIKEILDAALSFMKNKIITAENDKVAIILYGSRLSSNSLQFNNIFVFQKLDSPDA